MHNFHKIIFTVFFSVAISACTTTNINRKINLEPNYGYDGKEISTILEPMNTNLEPIKKIERLEAEKKINIVEENEELLNKLAKYSATKDENNLRLSGVFNSGVDLNFECDFTLSERELSNCNAYLNDSDFEASHISKILSGIFSSEYNYLFIIDKKIYSGKKGFINSSPLQNSMTTLFESIAPEISPEVNVSDSHYEILGKSIYKNREVVVVGNKINVDLSIRQLKISAIVYGYNSFDMETGHMLSGKATTYMKTNGKLTNKTISRTSLIELEI